MALNASFTCQSCPGIQIGEQIKFVGGWFVTDNVFLQRKLRSHEWFGWKILEVAAADETVVEKTGGTDPDLGETAQGQYVIPNFEPSLGEEPPDETTPPIEHTRTSISKMNKADLCALSCELGLDWEGKSRNSLQVALKKKLDL